MTENCVFCNIAEGFEPTQLVRSSDDFVAFHDMFPKADTHVLVIPRQHHHDLDSFVADGGDMDGMLRFVSGIADEVGVGGRYRLLTNVGRDAGQMIFHLHWHMLSGDLSDL